MICCGGPCGKSSLLCRWTEGVLKPLEPNIGYIVKESMNTFTQILAGLKTSQNLSKCVHAFFGSTSCSAWFHTRTLQVENAQVKFMLWDYVRVVSR